MMRTRLHSLLSIMPGLIALIALGMLRADTIQADVNAPLTAAEAAAIQQAIVAEQTSFGWPVRIRIPAIGVNTALVNVGLRPDGMLDAPQGPKEAGWYRAGTQPGKPGSAVIDGHSGWSHGIHASFDDLYKLKPGDKIYLEDQKGIVLAFTMRSSERFGEHDDISSIFHSSDGAPHLNLITCNGTWKPSEHTYTKRLVVYSDL